MANKFTKLNIGDTVASGSGRAWKKLTAEEEPNFKLSDGSKFITADNKIFNVKE